MSLTDIQTTTNSTATQTKTIHSTDKDTTTMNPSDPQTSATQSPVDSAAIEDRFISAFKRREGAIAAVPADALQSLNLDVPTVYTTIVGAVPHLQSLRSDLTKSLPGFDLSLIDGLVDDALALGSAHARWKIATEMGASLPEMMAEATRQRDRLYLHAQALVDVGLFQQSSLDEIKRTGSYRGVAFEVISLVQLFSDGWARVSAKTAITSADVLAGSDAADRLTAAVAERDAQPKASAAAAVTRQKAFTLLAQHYDRVRQAVSFLRWNEGDADVIAPSLYAGRGNGNHKSNKAAEPAQPGGAVAPPASPTTPIMPATHTVDPKALADAGLPGASPYLS